MPATFLYRLSVPIIDSQRALGLLATATAAMGEIESTHSLDNDSSCTMPYENNLVIHTCLKSISAAFKLFCSRALSVYPLISIVIDIRKEAYCMTRMSMDIRCRGAP
jgi:hypothetical protein